MKWNLADDGSSSGLVRHQNHLSGIKSLLPRSDCQTLPASFGMALRDDVLTVLNALCEEAGVCEDSGGDFAVDGQVILRADLAASPFVPAQLQRILEDFDGVLAEVPPLAQECSEP
jgi:hypothetical protein